MWQFICHTEDVAYFLPSFYKNHTQKITIICPIHGEFKQSFIEHINQKHGCPKCSGLYSPTTEEWIEKANLIHKNKYDYSKVNYINNRTKVIITCPIHGDFEQFPENHLKGYGCYKCNRSIGEAKIAKVLENYKLNFKEQYSFKQLSFKGILKFDFYLPKLNTVIEYNGRQHYEWVKLFDKTYKDFLESRHRDWLKRRYCKRKGIKLVVIPYWDFEVIKEKLKVNSIGENK